LVIKIAEGRTANALAT